MQNIQNFCKIIEECTPGRKIKVLIVFGNMIADVIRNKKLNQIVTELFIKGRNLNISTAVITQSYFAVPRDARLNCTYFLFWKFQTNDSFNKLHLIIHQILAMKTMNRYKECTAKPYSFLVNCNALTSDIPLRFRSNLFYKEHKTQS